VCGFYPHSLLDGSIPLGLRPRAFVIAWQRSVKPLAGPIRGVGIVLILRTVKQKLRDCSGGYFGSILLLSAPHSWRLLHYRSGAART